MIIKHVINLEKIIDNENLKIEKYTNGELLATKFFIPELCMKNLYLLVKKGIIQENKL